MQVECKDCTWHKPDLGTPYCSCRLNRPEHEEGHDGCPEGFDREDAKAEAKRGRQEDW